jgi:hypothetical protein
LCEEPFVKALTVTTWPNHSSDGFCFTIGGTGQIGIGVAKRLAKKGLGAIATQGLCFAFIAARSVLGVCRERRRWS